VSVRPKEHYHKKNHKFWVVTSVVTGQ